MDTHLLDTAVEPAHSLRAADGPRLWPALLPARQPAHGQPGTLPGADSALTHPPPAGFCMLDTWTTQACLKVPSPQDPQPCMEKRRLAFPLSSNKVLALFFGSITSCASKKHSQLCFQRSVACAKGRGMLRFRPPSSAQRRQESVLGRLGGEIPEAAHMQPGSHLKPCLPHRSGRCRLFQAVCWCCLDINLQPPAPASVPA